ncbi:MAG: hypothetical protein L0Z50_23980, partial [Verrucomicrobiales bacterium]|nr:hypothetical protein [Verrucomicrobiales bacterium]
MGEKLVLAISDEVTIRTTNGGIRFDTDGRHGLRTRQTVGSRIECLLRMTETECRSVEAHAQKLISPERIATLFNGTLLTPRRPLEQFRVTLPTELGSDDGYLRQVDRETSLLLYDVLPGETATLYEMGIPVVETGDKWHYNIAQKVPLTFDRENVKPSFLRAVRVGVFNHMHARVESEDVNSEWIGTAVASPDCTAEAMQSYMRRRFGEKRVSFDPSNSEANKLAANLGYALVHGSMMSAGAWKNAKGANAILPAGQVTPNPRVWTGQDAPNSPVVLDWIPESEWTDGMRQFADFAKRVAEKVLSRPIVVKFCVTPHLGTTSYGPIGELIFNKFRLGDDWFERGISNEVVQLLIHEFGYQYSLDHLSSEFQEAL